CARAYAYYAMDFW
nr:immunoglobulin heavy chain junction region [Mus musculus]MBK4184641.1 immunoglobulin heavy chain junction region [Mus musculus]MBK4184642.1 immunoglobulin heavy chain junction region [Mus musculus]MBK4184643.1 immunoglobulin heavy chain junction region [Mus musculus]MBK4190103.1 immunoglobulin heavy chain junction region [Mus musculus]